MRAIAALLGTMLLLGCTDAQPASTVPPVGPSTTTTVTTTRPVVDPEDFEMSTLVDGDPVAWTSSLRASADLREIVEIGSVTFAVASGENVGEVVVWSTRDGVDWTRHGDIAVRAAGPITAIGTNGSALLIASAGAPGQGPTVLATSDGSNWRVDHIPVDADNPLMVFTPVAIGGTENLTVVAVESHPDPAGLLSDRLARADLPHHDVLADYDVSYRAVGTDLQIQWIGPAGFVLSQATASDLGISEQEQQWMIEESQATEMGVWAKTAGGTWQPSVIEGATSVLSLFDTSRGDVYATGATGTGVAMWRTFEGLSWEQVPFAERPLTAIRFGERNVGVSLVGESDVLISETGEEWTRTGLQMRFPASPDFVVHYLAAGRSGVLATVESFEFRPFSDESFFPTIERDGLTAIAQSNGVSILEGSLDGEITAQHDFFASSSAFSDDVQIDIDARTITFMAPGGSPLMSLTLDELEELARRQLDLDPRFNHFTRHGAIAYSEDTASWTLWDLAELHDAPTVLDVGLADRSLLVALGADDGFEIWSAPLP